MNVLSLFDGISCGQVALQRAGVSVTQYFVSEIDKHAISITTKNFPNTIHLGDIKNIVSTSLPRIDLLIGGSPCQGFSFAGKQLNFNDPRSALFFEYVRLLNEVKPSYFLLENVNMKQEYQDVISNLLKCAPIKINSALMSAQNRVRLYWTNIPDITQPNDRGIYLEDILESGVVDKDKSYCIDANYWKGTPLPAYFEKHRRQLVFQPLACSERGRRLNPDATKRDDKHGIVVRGYEITGKKTCALTTVQKDNLITENYEIRKLTPIECERLQTLPDNYTAGVSNTQRYKMLGNAWTVDVMAHIFKGINEGI